MNHAPAFATAVTIKSDPHRESLRPSPLKGPYHGRDICFLPEPAMSRYCAKELDVIYRMRDFLDSAYKFAFSLNRNKKG